MKVFDAAAFLASDTGKRLKAILAGHLPVLDGRPVQDIPGSLYGYILYEADGQSWELYPVMPERCVEDAQERLF